MVQARNVLKRLNMERLFAETEERALTKGKNLRAKIAEKLYLGTYCLINDCAINGT